MMGRTLAIPIYKALLCFVISELIMNLLPIVSSIIYVTIHATEGGEPWENACTRSVVTDHKHERNVG